MRAFAALTERLAFESGRAAKLTLIADYLAAAPDPDRGYALAALAGTLDFPAAKPAILRGLIEARLDRARALAALIRAFGEEGKRIAKTAAQYAAPFSTEGFAEKVEACYLKAIEAHKRG